MKNTKRALLLSALAIVMSIAMLIGSTFAWFTDSASTAVNTIQSGTLKVALEMFDVEQNKWVDAEGKSLEWVTEDDVTNVLWEPNCTYELPLIRVRNNGNLALKYEISVIGVTGDSKLLEVIDFTASIDGVAEVPLSTFAGHLDAFDDSSEILIKGHMDKDAGNEYQDKKIENIAISVLATQYTYESDSNDDQYDKDAAYPRPGYIAVPNFNTFTNVINNVQDGEEVKLYLTNNIIIDETLTLDKNVKVELDLNGKTIQGDAKTLIELSDGEIDIYNGTIKNVQQNASSTFVSIELSGDAKATIKDTTIETSGIGILMRDNAVITELSAKVDSYANANGTRSFNGVELNDNARIDLISGGEYSSYNSEEYIEEWKTTLSYKGAICYPIEINSPNASIGEISGGVFLGEMDKANNGTPIHVNAGTLEKISGGYFGFCKWGLSAPTKMLFVNTSNGGSIGKIVGGTFEVGVGYGGGNNFGCNFASIVDASNCQIVDTNETVVVKAQFSTVIKTYTLNVWKVIAK